MATAGYNDFVFVNCPFDAEYMPLFQAIIYTVYRCGFIPLCALGEDDGSDNRLDKIIRCIEGCRYGIHDISRTEVNQNNFPRFNMPFELGVFFGAKRLGSREQKNKNAIIFERTQYTYQQYISDLSGVDTKAHNNDPNMVIRQLRDWLHTASSRKTIPGYTVLQQDYGEFVQKLPAIVELAGLNRDDIPFNDFCQIVEEAVREKIRQ